MTMPEAGTFRCAGCGEHRPLASEGLAPHAATAPGGATHPVCSGLCADVVRRLGPVGGGVVPWTVETFYARAETAFAALYGRLPALTPEDTERVRVLAHVIQDAYTAGAGQ